MSDFFQNSMITTLQKLGNRPLENLEAEILSFSRDQKITLLLPALYSEFTGPAMPKIIPQIREIPYLNRIVLSLDRATEEEFHQAKRYFNDFSCDVKIIWQDSPDILGIYQALQSEDFYIGTSGKGRGVWLAMGYILAQKEAKIVALHDCDILTYDRGIVAKLVYPLASPAFSYEFSKGYFARYGKKLYGRVTRLFVTPIIKALQKVLGKLTFLEYLNSFRYPLSGEFAILTDIAAKIRTTPDYGLEMITLGEVYNNTMPSRICQVELLENYEHKHQEISLPDGGGLTRMVKDISKALFRILAQEGNVFNEAIFRTLRVTCINLARDAVQKYEALAKFNGLTFDRHDEMSALEAFSEAMHQGIQEFLADPLGTPLMPAWQRVFSALPNLGEELKGIIEEENKHL